MPPTVAWMFPGQGSQQVGMGKELAERYGPAARAFDEASDALGFDLRRLCWDGPQGELDRTANAQPAIVTTSVAALRAALEDGLSPDAVVCLGHSVGEYAALVAAGALDLPTAVRLVRRRGELMQSADGPASSGGGMAAVIGLDAGAIGRAIDGTGLVVANDNAPGQVVISGPLNAFGSATTALRSAGAKRILPLRVSGAFHSPAMRAMAADLRRALDAARWGDMRVPVIANVDALAHDSARDFPELLERQVWSPVRWVESVRRARDMGATTFVEVGAGSVLTGLVKRILPDARTGNVCDPASLESAISLPR
jgi:[acyl-carrier-protein] S-malonyltransferase